MNLQDEIRGYVPWNEQEVQDQAAMLAFLQRNSDALMRENRSAHFSASAWIVNQDGSKVLMAYHRLYDSWAWLGGHADGESDLLQTALREAREESGLCDVKPLMTAPFSLEILPVFGHVKKGCYVPSHTHLNLTYLLQADDGQKLFVKEDENSGVQWFRQEEALQKCTEPWMVRHVYSKLMEKWQKMRQEFGV